MRSPRHRGDRGLQGASEANGEPELPLALSLSAKRRDKVRRRSVADKVWRQGVETRCGDKVWRQGVPPGGERAAQRFYPLNCEPLCGRNNRLLPTAYCHCRRPAGAAATPGTAPDPSATGCAPPAAAPRRPARCRWSPAAPCSPPTPSGKSAPPRRSPCRHGARLHRRSRWW